MAGRAKRPGAHVISAAISRAAERAVPVLPGALDGPLSEILGSAAFALAPRARSAVRANLAVIGPGHDRVVGDPASRGADAPRQGRYSARRVFVAQARHYMETFRLLRLERERLLAMVEIEGWANLTRAVARGRGVVLASAHLGPVVLCGQVLAARGLDVSVLVEPKMGELGRAIDRARSSLGIKTIETTTPLELARALRRGGIVGLLADRAITGVGERVTFFGREALLPSAHVALALRSGAALVAGFAVREGGRLRAVAEPELALARTGDREADVREGMRQWAALLEGWVRRAPEQWSVFDPVWER